MDHVKFFLLATLKASRHSIEKDNNNLDYVWQYFAVTNHADAKKAGPRMLSVIL